MVDTSVSRPIRVQTSESVLRSGTLLLNHYDPRLRPAVSTSRRSGCDKRPVGGNISRCDGGMSLADNWCHTVTSHLDLHSSPAFLMHCRPITLEIESKSTIVLNRVVLRTVDDCKNYSEAR
jgi:hypothetical protein